MHPSLPPSGNTFQLEPGTALPVALWVGRRSDRGDVILSLMAGLPWQLRTSYSLDQALDMMRQGAPSVVMVDTGPGCGWGPLLAHWIECVSAVLPLLVLREACDADPYGSLQGRGVFRSVDPHGLTASILSDLLDEALHWAHQTGRRRSPHPNGLLSMTWQSDGQLLAMSHQLLEALGWRHEDLGHSRLDDVVAAPSLDLRERWSEAGTQQLQLKRRDGSLWPVSVTRQPMTGSDRSSAHMLGIFTDSVSLRRLDSWSQRRVALVTQKLKAERTSQTKSRFMAAITHDLRQPMHAIGLFLGELSRRSADPDTERMVGHMALSLASMESLLDSVLALARLEAPEMVPNLSTFPIEPLLGRLRVNHSAAAQRKQLHLGVASHDALVVSDPILLERILSNLVANAVQYTHRGGVLVTCRSRGQHLRIQVWDTGVGIPMEHRDAVFHEFYRIEGQGGNGKGVGLGLSIVRSCATLLGLQVGLRSEVGRGSCFTVDVPISPKAEASDSGS